MTDELELLKKDWQKKEEHLPKLSYGEIHTMIWKKSSSIVKWILIISVLEFVLPHLLYLLPSVREEFYIKGADNFMTIYISISILYYLTVFFFIYKFYSAYKEISVLDNAKRLMRKIIGVRRIVKYYIIFCLTMALVIFGVFILGINLDDNVLLAIVDKESIKDVSLDKLRSITTWALAIGGVIFTLLLGGIYFLLYGLLLRKLNKNYKELKKLEI